LGSHAKQQQQQHKQIIIAVVDKLDYAFILYILECVLNQIFSTVFNKFRVLLKSHVMPFEVRRPTHSSYNTMFKSAYSEIIM